MRVESGPDGVQVTVDGRRLTSPRPREGQERRLPAVPDDQTLYLIESPLAGYGLEQFRRRLPPSSSILAVELHPALRAFAHHPETDFHVAAGLSRADDAASAVATCRRLLPRTGIRRVTRIALSGGAHLLRRDYDEVADAVTACVHRFWRNRGTQIALTRRWMANLARNALVDSVPPTALAVGRYSAALLIGAGPSLDLHRELVRQIAAGRAAIAIVALDTALPALASLGIRPDAVVSMDAQLANARDLLPWRWDGVDLLADVTCHPGIVRRFDARRRSLFASEFHEFSDGDLQALVAGIPAIPPLGSVAPAAIHILTHALGMGRIALVGVDFHYRAPQTHAVMSAIDRTVRRARTRLQWPDGNDDALLRPRTTASARDGSRIDADRVLADHAERTAELIAVLHREPGGCRIAALPGNGLDLGCPTVAPADVVTFLSGSPDGTEPAVRGAAVARHGSPRPLGGTPETDASLIRKRRAAALERIVARLRSQEARLESSSFTILDAGLDFVALDMPQWPLMMTRHEWLAAQHGRLLRSVRDYRRRFSRSAAGISPPARP